MAATTIADQVAQLDHFGRLEIRHQVDAVYAVLLEANCNGFGVVTFRVRVERKNPGNLGIYRGIWEYRMIADLNEARRIANSHWKALRDGARP